MDLFRAISLRTDLNSLLISDFRSEIVSWRLDSTMLICSFTFKNPWFMLDSKVDTVLVKLFILGTKRRSKFEVGPPKPDKSWNSPTIAPEIGIEILSLDMYPVLRLDIEMGEGEWTGVDVKTSPREADFDVGTIVNDISTSPKLVPSSTWERAFGFYIKNIGSSNCE